MSRRYALLLGALAFAGCGDDKPAVPTFNKTVPSVEQRYHGRTLADWKSYDPEAPDELRTATAYALAALEKEPAESVPLLIELMEDKAPTVRLAAVIATGRLRPSSERLARMLVAYLPSKDEPLRRHARLAVGKLGASAVKPLTEALASDEVRVRWGAAAALATVGTAGAAAVPHLKTIAVEDENATVRRQALLTLPRLGPTGVDAGIAFLRSEEFSRREEAAAGLAGAGADAVEALHKLIQSPFEQGGELAALAAGILADIGPAARPAMGSLLQMLHEKGPSRFNAAEALIAIGEPAVAHLETMASGDNPDDDIAQIAKYALEKIRGN